jgi:pimeloyl-ACP methyl ester carboxylesterase
MITQKELIRLDIEGHTLYARYLNQPEHSGVPIILIHGGGLTLNFWSADMFPALTKLGPCYSLSLIGHTPATLPTDTKYGDLTQDNFIGIMSEAVGQLCGRRAAVLLGHSVGAFAVLAVAAYRPQQAAGVITIGGFAQGRAAIGYIKYLMLALRYLPPSRWLIPRLLFDPLKKRTIEQLRPRFEKRILPPGQSLSAYKFFDAPAWANRYLADARGMDSSAMLKLYYAVPDFDIMPVLANITAPVLLLHGEKEDVIPVAHARKMAEYMNQVELAVLPLAGHNVPFIENPQAFYRAIDDWLVHTELDSAAPTPSSS